MPEDVHFYEPAHGHGLAHDPFNSIVGPRPIVPAEAVHYGVHIATYQAVRPGLTGAWQVSGRSDVSYDQRVSLDCHYVETRNLRRDIGIILLTIPAVLKSKGSY